MSASARPIALTIGVFDGLHRGHQEIVAATLAEARSRSGAAWVATFDPHPDSVVRGTPDRPWITPPGERASLLHAMGVDRVETVRFDDAVRGLTPEGFLDRVLGPGAPLEALVAGPDFHMGKGRTGDRAYLEELGRKRGFTYHEVAFLESGGAKLSSTRLRQEIAAGAVDQAADIMGRPYALEGTVGSGAGRGTTLGFPTANLEVRPEKLLPAPGIYLSQNQFDGRTWPGITYVGSAGTFGPGPVRVEVFLIDYTGVLRGRWLKTLLISQLRADRVFRSADELIRAMDDDLARARAFWAGARQADPAR